MNRRDPVAGPCWPLVLIATVTVTAAIATLASDRGGGAAEPLEPRLVDLDRADAVDLDLLPGIGPALASRIIADRETNGPFGSVDSLARVRGVGPAIVEGIRPHVRAVPAADPGDG